MKARFFMKMAFLLFFILLANCTMRTSFNSHFVAPDMMKLAQAPAFRTKFEDPVHARSCFTKVGYPFYWSSQVDTMVEKAMKEHPAAVGFVNAEFSSEVFVLGVYNRICMEIKGQPVYVVTD